MNDCPTCGYPTIWSTRLERAWCSVYGDHRERYRGPNVVRGVGPISNVISFDIDRVRRAG